MLEDFIFSTLLGQTDDFVTEPTLFDPLVLQRQKLIQRFPGTACLDKSFGSVPGLYHGFVQALDRNQQVDQLTPGLQVERINFGDAPVGHNCLLAARLIQALLGEGSIDLDGLVVALDGRASLGKFELHVEVIEPALDCPAKHLPGLCVFTSLRTVDAYLKKLYRIDDLDVVLSCQNFEMLKAFEGRELRSRRDDLFQVSFSVDLAEDGNFDRIELGLVVVTHTAGSGVVDIPEARHELLNEVPALSSSHGFDEQLFAVEEELEDLGERRVEVIQSLVFVMVKEFVRLDRP